MELHYMYYKNSIIMPRFIISIRRYHYRIDCVKIWKMSIGIGSQQSETLGYRYAFNTCLCHALPVISVTMKLRVPWNRYYSNFIGLFQLFTLVCVVSKLRNFRNKRNFMHIYRIQHYVTFSVLQSIIS